MFLRYYINGSKWCEKMIHFSALRLHLYKVVPREVAAMHLHGVFVRIFSAAGEANPTETSAEHRNGCFFWPHFGGNKKAPKRTSPPVQKPHRKCKSSQITTISNFNQKSDHLKISQVGFIPSGLRCKLSRSWPHSRPDPDPRGSDSGGNASSRPPPPGRHLTWRHSRGG